MSAYTVQETQCSTGIDVMFVSEVKSVLFARCVMSSKPKRTFV